MNDGAAYIMNQQTFALVLTVSDAMGRPIMLSMPTAPRAVHHQGLAGAHRDANAGRPGAVPVVFSNWRAAYTLVTRKAVTLQMDPYSAGFCIVWKWEARIGGSVTCSNAARLLRIR